MHFCLPLRTPYTLLRLPGCLRTVLTRNHTAQKRSSFLVTKGTILAWTLCRSRGGFAISPSPNGPSKRVQCTHSSHHGPVYIVGRATVLSASCHASCHGLRPPYDCFFRHRVPGPSRHQQVVFHDFLAINHRYPTHRQSATTIRVPAVLPTRVRTSSAGFFNILPLWQMLCQYKWPCSVSSL